MGAVYRGFRFAQPPANLYQPSGFSIRLLRFDDWKKHTRGYLSFRVARPRSAKMAERIQNRTMTVFSFQPLSSKWW